MKIIIEGTHPWGQAYRVVENTSVYGGQTFEIHQLTFEEKWELLDVSYSLVMAKQKISEFETHIEKEMKK